MKDKIILLLLVFSPLFANAQEVISLTQSQTIKGKDTGNGILLRPNLPIGYYVGPYRNGPSFGLGLNVVYKFNSKHYLGIGSIFWAGHNLAGVVGTWPDSEYGEGGDIIYWVIHYLPLFVEYRRDVTINSKNRMFLAGRVGFPMGKNSAHPHYFGIDRFVEENGVTAKWYRLGFPYIGLEAGYSMNKFDISLLCSMATLKEISIPENITKVKPVFSFGINLAYNFRVIKTK